MNTIDELSEAVKQVMLVANKIGNEVNAEIWAKAPIIIHQRFCHELVKVVKMEENKGKPTTEIPRAMEILNAINILMDFYPQLDEKNSKAST